MLNISRAVYDRILVTSYVNHVNNADVHYKFNFKGIFHGLVIKYSINLSNV